MNVAWPSLCGVAGRSVCLFAKNSGLIAKVTTSSNSLIRIGNLSTTGIRMGCSSSNSAKEVDGGTNTGDQPVTMEKARPIVLSGPSGCGKSTLIKKLMKDFPNRFGFSVSHTTRGPRPGEVNGKDYHFTDKETMKGEIEKGMFIEHAEFNQNMYGTSKKAVQDVTDEGQICILDIDMQGVVSVKKTDLDCLLLFVKPPTVEELERRLRGRGTETEESIQRRLNTSKIEFEYAAVPGNYHHILVNDELEKAYNDLKKIISSEVTPLT